MSKKLKSHNSSVADSHDSESHDPDGYEADKQRRKFLRYSVSTAMGVAVSAAAIQAVASVESTGETVSALKTENKDGYRLTKHIAEYYKSAAI